MERDTNKNPNQNKLTARTKIILWNALIRSTLTYAIQTQDIAAPGQQNIDGFALRCLRQIQHIYRYNEIRKPQKSTTHAALRQPKTTSWVNKLRTTNMPEKQQMDGTYATRKITMRKAHMLYGHKSGKNMTNKQKT